MTHHLEEPNLLNSSASFSVSLMGLYKGIKNFVYGMVDAINQIASLNDARAKHTKTDDV